jgi:hypothetical protein
MSTAFAGPSPTWAFIRKKPIENMGVKIQCSFIARGYANVDQAARLGPARSFNRLVSVCLNLLSSVNFGCKAAK